MKKKNSLWKKSLAAVATLTLAFGCMTGCGATEEDTASTTQKDTAAVEQEVEAESSEQEDSQYADTITLVWYPNESADNFTTARDKLVEQATGKKVEQQLTTDYAIAIEAVSNGTAQIGCIFGGEGYVQAKNGNDAVELLFVPSGASETLDDRRGNRGS